MIGETELWLAVAAIGVLALAVVLIEEQEDTDYRRQLEKSIKAACLDSKK